MTIRNAVQCNDCGTVLESKHEHDFVTCPCEHRTRCCDAKAEWRHPDMTVQPNAVICTGCGAEWPACKGISIDGGPYYSKRIGDKGNWTEVYFAEDFTNEEEE